MVGILDTKEGVNALQRNQEFFEKGVGDTTAGSRFLGAIMGTDVSPSEKITSETSSLDPVSRAIYNVVAPYGKLGLNIADTILRLPGAGAADIANMFGVEEKDVNEIQALTNSVIFQSFGQGSKVVGAGSQVKNVAKNVVDEAAVTAKYFPDYNPLKKPQLRSVGAQGNEFFDYGYRFKPSDRAPTDPLGELKKASEIPYQTADDQLALLAKKRAKQDELREVRFNRKKKIEETQSPKLSKSEELVIDTSLIKESPEGLIYGSLEGMNKRLPLKTKVKEGGSKVYKRKEEISDPYLNNVAKNEKITDYFKKIGEDSEFDTFLIRAHQLEQSAVGKIKKAGFDLPRNFSIYEMIPQKQLKYMLSESRNYDPRYAQSLSTQKRNMEHQKVGGDLIAQLVTKYDAMGYTFKPFTDKRGGVWVFNKNKVKSPEKIEEINAEMTKSIDKINDLKIPVMFYNPAKNRMVTYGEPPKNVSVDLRKSVEAGVKEGNFSLGGIVGIDELTQSVSKI
jgi:hypothetical protein